MANNQLNITSGTGTQTGTQSPQSAGQSDSTTTQSSNLQPGTATTLLNGQGSVQLHQSELSTVSLNGSAAAVTAVPVSSPPKHHINPVLFGLSGVLLVVAIVLFWITSRSVKNTTQY